MCLERQLDAAFLMGLRVHPQHFGRGIGARLTVRIADVLALHMLPTHRPHRQALQPSAVTQRAAAVCAMSPCVVRCQEAAEAAARDLPGVSSLQTATIMANGAMRAILSKQGWQVGRLAVCSSAAACQQSSASFSPA